MNSVSVERHCQKMKYQIKHILEIASFVLLGIFFIIFAFIGTGNLDYIDYAKIVLFICLGVFSLTVAITDLVINRYDEEIDFKNHILGIFALAGIIEGTYLLFANVFILSFVIYLLPLVILALNIIYKHYKCKNKVKTIDDYLIIGITFAGLLLEILYLIFKILPFDYSGVEFVLNILALVILSSFIITYLINFVFCIIENFKFDLKSLKLSGSIFTLIFLGAFHMALNYELLFGDGVTFSPSIGYMSCFIIGVISIILGLVLYFIIRKNLNNKDFDEYKISLIFLTAIQSFQFIICLFFYGPQQIEMFIPWSIVVIIPLITVFVKYTFSKIRDVSAWFEIISDVCIIIFVIFGTVWCVINYASFDYLPIYLAVFISLSLFSSISVLTFTVPNLIENFKDTRE